LTAQKIIKYLQVEKVLAIWIILALPAAVTFLDMVKRDSKVAELDFKAQPDNLKMLKDALGDDMVYKVIICLTAKAQIRLSAAAERGGGGVTLLNPVIVAFSASILLQIEQMAGEVVHVRPGCIHRCRNCNGFSRSAAFWCLHLDAQAALAHCRSTISSPQ